MNTRAAILAMALAAGASVSAALAQQESVPPPLQLPGGVGARPQHPLGALRDGSWSRTRRTPNDRLMPGDGGLGNSNLRPDWLIRDGDASSLQAAEDSAGVVTAVDHWLPPTSGDRASNRRDAVRNLRNGLRDALARATELDETILSMSVLQNENRRTPESSSSSGSREDRVRFRIGVSHLSPKVEMRYDMRGSALGLSVSALGQVRVDLAPTRSGSGMFQAGIDPVDGRYDLGYRLSF